MLVDIQITVAKILRENQELKQEILELKSALNVNQRETEKLKTQLTKAEKANDTLRNELNHIRMKLKDQIEEMNKLDEKPGAIITQNSLEILGVPEGAYTSTDEVVIRIGEATNVDIKAEDIEISHKRKRKTTKLVIVKFVSLSHKVKSLFYKARTKLKKVKTSDVFPSCFRVSRRPAYFYQRESYELSKRAFLERKQDEER